MKEQEGAGAESKEQEGGRMSLKCSRTARGGVSAAPEKEGEEGEEEKPSEPRKCPADRSITRRGWRLPGWAMTVCCDPMATATASICSAGLMRVVVDTAATATTRAAQPALSLFIKVEKELQGFALLMHGSNMRKWDSFRIERFISVLSPLLVATCHRMSMRQPPRPLPANTCPPPSVTMSGHVCDSMRTHTVDYGTGWAQIEDECGAQIILQLYSNLGMYDCCATVVHYYHAPWFIGLPNDPSLKKYYVISQPSDP